MSEKCQRCGEEGEDRRTLWMACFYEMSELGLPFEMQTLFHADRETLVPASPPDDLKLDDKTTIRIRAGTVTTTGELYPHKLFTLLVCKRCRADWLLSIRQWFEDKPEPEDGGLEAGAIYERQFGTNRRVS